MDKILIIHGPNLNLLGTRQPEVYGSNTLEMINDKIEKEAKLLNIKISFYQSNLEGEIVNGIHEAKKEKVKYIVINTAGLTFSGHTI